MCNDLIKCSVLALLTTEMQVLVLVLYLFCKKKRKSGIGASLMLTCLDGARKPEIQEETQTDGQTESHKGLLVKLQTQTLLTYHCTNESLGLKRLF